MTILIVMTAFMQLAMPNFASPEAAAMLSPKICIKIIRRAAKEEGHDRPLCHCGRLAQLACSTATVCASITAAANLLSMLLQASAAVQVKEEQPAKLKPALLSRMKCFVQQFLAQGAYSHLMATLRRELEPGVGISRLSRASFVQFLQLARACTAFVRLQQVQCGLPCSNKF